MRTEDLYLEFKRAGKVSTDTRNIEKGDLFFALKGENFNGNRFAEDALKKGALKAIIDEEEFHDKEKGTILVNDSLKSLQDLAHFHRRQFDIPLLCITGSNGKTTTKELTARVLQKKYNTFATPGNLNNHIGVPLTLLKLTREVELAIIELGANHPGENSLLSKIADPDHGLITNVGMDHLEGFKDLEGVIKGNGELFDHLREKNGTIFLNQDDKTLLKLGKGLQAISYGTGEAPDIQGRILSHDPYLHLEWKEKGESKTNRIDTQLIGKYNLPNILAAITIGWHFGVKPSAIDKAIACYSPDNNRSQIERTDRNTLILDAYNANPSSMEAAIENFAEMDQSKKFYILGDMLEMGDYEEEVHQRIIDLLLDKGLNNGILVGRAFKKAASRSSIKAFRDVEEAKKELESIELENNLILIKGSRGIHLENAAEVL